MAHYTYCIQKFSFAWGKINRVEKTAQAPFLAGTLWPRELRQLFLQTRRTNHRHFVSFNSYLRSSHLPFWKFVMLPKPNKTHNDPYDYCPIVLLNVLIKTFKRQFMPKYNILLSFQHGFRPSIGRKLQTDIWQQEGACLRLPGHTASIRHGLARAPYLRSPFSIVRIIFNFLTSRHHQVRVSQRPSRYTFTVLASPRVPHYLQYCSSYCPMERSDTLLWTSSPSSTTISKTFVRPITDYRFI